MSGGPYGPGVNPPSPPLKNRQNSLVLDFYSQHLKRVPVVFVSGGPYGPGGVLSIFEGGEGGVPKVFSRKDPTIVNPR